MYILSFFKTLAVSWIDSLKFFLPKNLNILLFSTYKTILDFFRTVKNNFFYIVIIFLLFFLIALISDILSDAFVLTQLSLDRTSIPFLISPWIINRIFIVYFICINFLIQAARPSVNNKSSKYFSNFYTMLINLIVFFGLFSIFRYFNINYIAEIFMINQIYIGRFIQFGTYFISPFIIFWLLFTYDAQKTYLDYFRSFKRSFLMVLYNYPFCFIVYNIIRLIILLLARIKIFFYNFSMITSTIIPFVPVNLVFILLILPIYTFFMTNFYIIQVHNKFSLYYGNKNKKIK